MGHDGVPGPQGLDRKAEYASLRGRLDGFTREFAALGADLAGLHDSLDAAVAVRSEYAPRVNTMAQKVALLLLRKKATEKKLYRLQKRIEQVVAATRALQLSNPLTAQVAMQPAPVPRPPRKDPLLQAIKRADRAAAAAGPALVAPRGSAVNEAGMIIQPNGEPVMVNGRPAMLPAGSTVGKDGSVQSKNGWPVSAASTVPVEAEPTMDPSSPYRVVAVVKNFAPAQRGGKIYTSVQPILIRKDEP